MVVRESSGGTNRTAPSFRRALMPLRQFRIVERLIPTSRRAAAGAQPHANSFKNC